MSDLILWFLTKTIELHLFDIFFGKIDITFLVSRTPMLIGGSKKIYFLRPSWRSGTACNYYV